MRGVVLAVVVGSLLGLAGCGGGDVEKTETVSPEVVAGAIGKVNLAGGLQVRMRSTVTGITDRGRPATITGSGVIDVNNGIAKMRIDMTALAGLAHAANGAELERADFIGEVRRTYLRLYRRFPFLLKSAGVREQWISSLVPAEPQPGAEGVDFSYLTRINGNDLVSTFEDLTYLVDAVRRPGEKRTIAGVETTRHDAKVDIAATPGVGQGDAGASFRAFTGSTRYPVTVWIDEKGFARAVRWTVSHKTASSDPNRLQNSRRTVEVTIEKIGVPAREEPPPKADTIKDTEVGTIGI